MEKILLAVSARAETGKRVRALRRAGDVPAVAYGHGTEPLKIKTTGRELERAYQQAGTSRILSLQIDGEPAKNVLFQEVQFHPLTGKLVHADFYLVRMDEKIKTEIPLHFVGESVAVYQEGGTLLKNLEALEIEALPGDLPENFEVDIAVLDDFEKVIHVSDLVIPSGVEVLTPSEELIAKVEPPKTDEQLEEELAEAEQPVGEVPSDFGSAEGEAPTEAAEGESTEKTEAAES